MFVHASFVPFILFVVLLPWIVLLPVSLFPKSGGWETAAPPPSSVYLGDP